MLAVDAVLVVQFSARVTLGVFAVAVTDIPSAGVPRKSAHAELSLALLLNSNHGMLKAEAQQVPGLFMQHPGCHLTGGCALHY
jgi:hypothetical protein